MFIPFPVESDVIMKDGANRLVITNAHVEKDITIRLPKLKNSMTFEVLLLSPYKITLHANSETTKFLAEPATLKLVVGGNSKCVGRSLSISAYDSYWRVTQTTIPESNIVFKD